MIKLIRRLFRSSQSREINELREAQEGGEAGLNALADLAIGKHALAESIIRNKELASDLAGGNVNQHERMVLNLWGVTLCIMRNYPNVNHDEKTAFLDQYHELIRLMCRPEDEGARSAWTTDFRGITELSQTRYPEYFAAFNEMMLRLEARQHDPSSTLVPGAPLMRAVAKNVFSLESDSLLLAVSIQIIVMNMLVSFAKAFGTPGAWKTMRHFVENACRAAAANV